MDAASIAEQVRSTAQQRRAEQCSRSAVAESAPLLRPSLLCAYSLCQRLCFAPRCAVLISSLFSAACPTLLCSPFACAVASPHPLRCALGLCRRRALAAAADRRSITAPLRRSRCRLWIHSASAEINEINGRAGPAAVLLSISPSAVRRGCMGLRGCGQTISNDGRDQAWSTTRLLSRNQRDAAERCHAPDGAASKGQRTAAP